MAEKLGSISIEPFRGGFAELHAMALDSWRNEYEMPSFPDLFDPAYIAYLAGPNLPPDHLVAAYDHDACVAFVANIPRTLVVRGRVVKGVVNSLLTVRRAYLRRGLAEKVVHTSLTWNERHHYDLALFHMEHRPSTLKFVEKLRHPSGHYQYMRWVVPFVRVLDFERVRRCESTPLGEYLAGVLLRVAGRPAARPLPGLRPYRPEDVEGCRELLNLYGATCDVARRFEREELDRALHCPGVAETLVVEREGAIVALVNWIERLHVSEHPGRWAWMNHLAFGELAPSERRALIAQFLRTIAARGCIAALTWNMGYYPMGPLLANRFFPHPRRLDIRGWIFNPEISVVGCRRLFDMQL